MLFWLAVDTFLLVSVDRGFSSKLSFFSSCCSHKSVTGCSGSGSSTAAITLSVFLEGLKSEWKPALYYLDFSLSLPNRSSL